MNLYNITVKHFTSIINAHLYTESDISVLIGLINFLYDGDNYTTDAKMNQAI